MRKYTSVFAQMLQMISRYDFQNAVRRYGAERHSKGFSSWGHFVALLFGQLSGQDGLRGVEAGMATQQKHLYHLGVKSVKRSTLSYANTNRTNKVFKSVFETMLTKVSNKAPGHKFCFKNDLNSFDATTIDLCLGFTTGRSSVRPRVASKCRSSSITQDTFQSL